MNIAKTLIAARDEYYNDGESTLTDAEYDILEQQLYKDDPANKFFTGIGAVIRGDKVKLPFKMGSLTQIWENDFAKWVTEYGLQIVTIVISAKMDGVSALLVYDETGHFQIGYSRGDGLEGQDISRHIAKIPNVPNRIMVTKTTTIRSECIISKSNFKKFQQECKDRNYKVYKNPRNAVAGLLNSKEFPEWIYKYLEIIAYELIGNESKLRQFEILSNQYNFTITPYRFAAGELWNDKKFENTILYNKNEGDFSDYEQDGIVIDISEDLIRKRMNPSTNSLNPAYSKKFKIREDINIVQATVAAVLWAPSKNKLVKPRVQLEPFDLNGVTITHTNGFNARYIIDNKINVGSQLMMVRSGDVIPYIISVLSESSEPSLPDFEDFGAYKFNETEVDFELLEENDIVKRKGIESFFSSLDISNIGPGVVKKLYENGYDTIFKIINMYEVDLILEIGKNGSKIYNGIQKRLDDVTEYEFIGSLPCFVGIGKRMFEKIYDHYGCCSDLTIEQITEVSGFELKSANKVVANYQKYYGIKSLINRQIIFKDKVVHNGALDDTIWVFTGYRDKAAQQTITENGGTIGSGIKKETTYLVTKDPSKKSNKLEKARELNIKILGPDEMFDILENI